MDKSINNMILDEGHCEIEKVIWDWFGGNGSVTLATINSPLHS